MNIFRRNRKNKYVPIIPITKGLILTSSDECWPFICNGRIDFKCGTIGAYGGIINDNKFKKATSIDRWNLFYRCRKATLEEMRFLEKSVEQSLILSEAEKYRYIKYIYSNMKRFSQAK